MVKDWVKPRPAGSRWPVTIATPSHPVSGAVAILPYPTTTYASLRLLGILEHLNERIGCDVDTSGIGIVELNHSKQDEHDHETQQAGYEGLDANIAAGEKKREGEGQ